ncbi:MAG: multicopper oxidase domain-containing protein [Flavobacteriales bacterium]
MKVFIILSLCLTCQISSAQTLLAIPDTLSGTSINLTMHADSVSFFPGNWTHTYAYNQYAYLGPTLIFQKGQTMDIHVQNNINDTTTVHWHGIHLPSKWDGGPHTEILAGNSWDPHFTVMDHAATYWYHPHKHMKTALQAIKGAAGLIIVRDPEEAALSLPRKYGVDDFPIIVQSQQYNNLNQAMPLGMEDSTILVNGAMANNGHEVRAEFPAQMVRMRLLNASGERVFNFGFTGSLTFHQIASDGGLLNTVFDTSRIRLAPGERAEIVLDLTGKEGQTLYLMSYASELPMGVQGGPTMPMPPGSPPMDSPLNGINFNVLKIEVQNQTSSPILSIPSVLSNDQVLNPSSSQVTREIRFTADSLMVMDGPFYFNDSSFQMDRIDFIIPVNQTETWKLVNETMVGHPFHLHDVQFYLFDRNGMSPSAQEKGRKDVAYLATGDSLMFVTKFEDFTDTLIPYMYHCHILMHEDAGMMGQFLVVPANYVGLHPEIKLAQELRLFPNPTESSFQLALPSDVEVFDLRITKISGEVVYAADHQTSVNVDPHGLTNGVYLVIVRANGHFYQSKLWIK